MNHMRLWIVAALIACLIVASFLVSVMRAQNAKAPGLPATASESVTVPSVTLKDSYKKGTHTITGSLLAPNACATPAADATLVGDASSTPSILVSVSLPDDTGVCLQRATIVSFSTTIEAAASLPITVEVNGVVATTTAP